MEGKSTFQTHIKDQLGLKTIGNRRFSQNTGQNRTCPTQKSAQQIRVTRNIKKGTGKERTDSLKAKW